jgi:sugar phosphate isomerase/epimerase
MMQELVDLGFGAVELGHGIRLSLVEGILKFLETNPVKISSLHNFCPLPVEITRPSPDCYKFSSHNPLERDRAIRQSKQTIDFARRLGAEFVVLHLGRVQIDDYTDQLIRLAEVGMHMTKKFAMTKLEAVRKREASQSAPFARALEVLREIVDYAGERGIRLGVESRHSYEEIPSEREMLFVLDQFPEPTVGYWHDFGHTHVKHNLGFVDHYEWMTRVSQRLIGCHLHDTKWPGRDHLAPFQGDVEYERLLPLLPRDTLFVFEMSPRRTREEILTALALWKERFGG